jgi:hypothetical protein
LSIPDRWSRHANRLALASDVLIVILLLSTVVVVLTGGFRYEVGGLRLSIRTPERLLLWAAILIVIRRLTGPPSSIWKSIRDGVARSRPLPADEHALFGAEGAWRSPRAAGELAAVLLYYAAVTIATTWPQIVKLYYVPDLGDPLFSTWRVAWVAHALATNPLNVFDGNIFFPERLTLTYSDATLVSGIMAAPLLWAGVHPVVAYNLTFLAGFALSGAAMYYLVRALTGSRAAAVVSGTIFAIYPYRFEHYSHLELQMVMGLPLALYALHRTIAFGRLRDGVLAGLALALQAQSSLYYALFATIYIPVVLGLLLWLTRRPLKPALPALAAGAVVASALVAPTAIAYVRNKPMLGERPYDAVRFYSAEARDYLTPHSRNILYRPIRGEAHPERELFPGVGPIALAIAGAWPPLSAGRLAYLAGLAVAFDGSLGDNGLIYPQLYRFVSPFRGLRVPARFSILVGLSLAVLAGYGIARLTAASSRPEAVAISAACVALLCYEVRPELNLEPVWRRPPPIYDAIDANPGVLFEWPAPRDWDQFWIDTRYEYFSVFHWHRLVNGNSGFSPPSYLELIVRVRDFPSDAALRYLRARGVQYVAIHRGFGPPHLYDRAVTVLGRRGDVQLLRTGRWEAGESRLYRLVP